MNLILLDVLDEIPLTLLKVKTSEIMMSLAIDGIFLKLVFNGLIDVDDRVLMVGAGDVGGLNGNGKK